MTSPHHESGTESRAASRVERRRHRRVDLDWMRGLAVVIMIGAHVLGAWTRPADKTSEAYSWTVVVAGMAAPMFLFTAGVAVALAGAARVCKGASVAEASAALVWRGCQIFGLAFLFRLQSWLLSPGAPLVGLLKVDILNIMGPALIGAGWLWGRTSPGTGRMVSAAAAAAVCGGLTPVVRGSDSRYFRTPLNGIFVRRPGERTSPSFRGRASCLPALRRASSSVSRARAIRSGSSAPGC